MLEGCSHWSTCAATNVGAVIHKQPLQGLRLTLALAMAHEHLIRCDKACYQGCAAAGTHVSQTLLGAFDAAGWRQQNRGFLATETDQASLVALLIGVEWTLLCFPGACRLGLGRVRRPPGLGLLSLCPQGLTWYSTTPHHPASATPYFHDAVLSNPPDRGARRPPAVKHQSLP